MASAITIFSIPCAAQKNTDAFAVTHRMAASVISKKGTPFGGLLAVVIKTVELTLINYLYKYANKTTRVITLNLISEDICYSIQ